MQLHRESPSARTTLPGADFDGTSSPEVLIPISPEDFSRRHRRMRIVIVAAAVVVLAIAGYIYKRATDPLRAREAFDAGERLYRIARYTQAIISLDSAIGYRSDFWEAYLLRGRARMGMGNGIDAIPDLSRVIQLRPGEPESYLARASAYLEI